MGKIILLFSVFGMLLVADVKAQGRGFDFRQFLMMQEREMALRRAFPFGIPGGTIPPVLAARLAAATGAGFIGLPFGIRPPIVGPLSVLGATMVRPGLGISPLEAALLRPSLPLGPQLPIGEPLPLGSGSLAATLGVDASTLGGMDTQAPSDTITGGTPQGSSEFGPMSFRGSPVMPGSTGFPTGGFTGAPTTPGGRFPVPAFRGQRRPGRFTPPPLFRRRFPPRPSPMLPLQRQRADGSRVLPRQRIPFRDFPQIPQIPQIPEGTFTSQPDTSGPSSTGGSSNSMTNPGTSTGMNPQMFPSIPSSVGSFNGRTSEFSTETSPNAIFPSQAAQAPVVVSQRQQTPSRFGSSGPQVETQTTQQFPEEPMIPQIPEIPSRTTASRRAPNGMLQFGNQGLNVRFSNLPTEITGGRTRSSQLGFTRRIGMRGIDFAILANQIRGPQEQQGSQAGPAFQTGTVTSQNMDIQFRPLPTNLQGQAARFDPDAMQSGSVATSGQQGTQIGSEVGGVSSVSQGSTFTIRKEAATNEPAEFQIVKVGNLPEFSGNIGNTVDVKMQGGQAIINSQAASSAIAKTESPTADVSLAAQEAMQPVGDISKASAAFSEITDLTGSITDLTPASVSAAAISATVDSSVSATTAVETSVASSSGKSITTPGTERLKLKSPLEPADFSFFVEKNDVKSASPADNTKEVITLTEAAVFEQPVVKKEISKSKPDQPTNDFTYVETIDPSKIDMLKQVFLTPEGLAFTGREGHGAAAISGSSTFEFPVQGTAAKAVRGSSATDFIFKAPNDIPTEISSDLMIENVQDTGMSGGQSFFRPPAVKTKLTQSVPAETTLSEGVIGQDAAPAV